MQGGIPILMYHSVDGQCSSHYRRWMMLPEEFDAHMSYLFSNGYRPVTMSQLAEVISSGATPDPTLIAITFDDGLRDFLTGALPVLSRYRFPATLYAVSGSIGKTSRWLEPAGEGRRAMLSWAELRELADAGIEIGAHTVNHPQLDILPLERARAEIEDSKHQLEEGLGRPVLSFAYPHGYSNAKIRNMVRHAGFMSACRVRHALSSVSENIYGLSRMIMTSAIGVSDLHELLAETTLKVAPPLDTLPAFGWRMARRFRNRANTAKDWCRAVSRNTNLNGA